MKISLLLFLLASPACAQGYSLNDIRYWADVIFRFPDHPPELDDPALSAATREFGPSVISLARLPIESGDARADGAAWSSWWYPKVDRDLFENGAGTSVLEKYDAVRAALTGRPSRAAAAERNAYDPARPRWEGLCDAWAIAATIFPEPRVPRVVKLPDGSTVNFSVGDLKALLLLSVDSVPATSLRTYGQRFTGNADGWIFPDIFPQELLRYVEKQLFERHRMFVMDHDPGVEVWSEPVYRASYRLAAIPGRADALAGKLWLYSATSYTDAGQRDRVGTKELAREYDYVLYGRPDGAGNLVIESGEWVKGDLVDSRRDHPDFVYHVADPASLERVSHNPEIEPRIVDKILGK
jgi:hypothetical protein